MFILATASGSNNLNFSFFAPVGFDSRVKYDFKINASMILDSLLISLIKTSDWSRKLSAFFPVCCRI